MLSPSRESFDIKPSPGKSVVLLVQDASCDGEGRDLPFAHRILLTQPFPVSPLLASHLALKRQTRMTHRSTGGIGGCRGKSQGPVCVFQSPPFLAVWKLEQADFCLFAYHQFCLWQNENSLTHLEVCCEHDMRSS